MDGFITENGSANSEVIELSGSPLVLHYLAIL